MRPPAVLAIHGGAGPAPHDAADSGASRWPRQAAGLAQALRAGLAVLAGGGEALEAVVAAGAPLGDDEGGDARPGPPPPPPRTAAMGTAPAHRRGRPPRG